MLRSLPNSADDLCYCRIAAALSQHWEE